MHSCTHTQTGKYKNAHKNKTKHKKINSKDTNYKKEIGYGDTTPLDNYSLQHIAYAQTRARIPMTMKRDSCMHC